MHRAHDRARDRAERGGDDLERRKRDRDREHGLGEAERAVLQVGVGVSHGVGHRDDSRQRKWHSLAVPLDLAVDYVDVLLQQTGFACSSAPRRDAAAPARSWTASAAVIDLAAACAATIWSRLVNSALVIR